jgi:spermidine/putrescine transport system ATP-binding protein
MTVSEFAVELRHIWKTFGAGSANDGVHAVCDVNLGIRKAEFFTLLGPSGCGKTTTLRLIAGFELPTRGELLIQGRQMADVPAHLRPVNTVFQSYALFPHLTVAENVGFGLAVKRVPKPERSERIRAALQLVQMEAMLDRRPAQLSGGQQQRVALARALVNQPGVLLLDEPFGALDLKLRKEMQLELKHMQRRLGITFVFVTHDQEEALTMSDRIAVMHKGRVLQVGNPVEIYERPTTRFGADFIGEMNFLAATVAGQSADAVTLELLGKRIEVPCVDTVSPPGSQVTLAIRPEALEFAGPGALSAPGYVSLHGTIAEEIYIGTDRRYVVTLADGSRAVVRSQNRSGERRGDLVPGSVAELRCRAADLRILAE